jgi:cell division protein FtsX
VVGASNWFVRDPYIIEGIIYSVIACLVLVVLFYSLAGCFAAPMDAFLGEYSLDLVATVNANFLWVIGWEVIVAIVITTLSGMIATRKYLRV